MRVITKGENGKFITHDMPVDGLAQHIMSVEPMRIIMGQKLKYPPTGWELTIKGEPPESFTVTVGGYFGNLACGHGSFNTCMKSDAFRNSEMMQVVVDLKRMLK